MKYGAITLSDLFNSSDNDKEVLNKLKQRFAYKEITLLDLTFQIPQGPHQGKSILWFIALDAANGNLGTFKDQFSFFKDQPEFLEALLAPAQEGLHEGKSALYWLACAAANGEPEAFLSVFNLYKDTPRFLEALLAPAQGKHHKGTSALWLIAFAIAKNKPEAFIAVFNHFKDDPALHNGLYAEVQAGSNQGVSALAFIIFAAEEEEEKNTAGPFKMILKNIKNMSLKEPQKTARLKGK